MSDSETSADEGPTKRAALNVPPPTSPAKRVTATPTVPVPVKNPRKRKIEPVVGGAGKAPKKRRRNE